MKYGLVASKELAEFFRERYLNNSLFHLCSFVYVYYLLLIEDLLVMLKSFKSTHFYIIGLNLMFNSFID